MLGSGSDGGERRSEEATEQLEQMAARRAVRLSAEATDEVYASEGLPPLAKLKQEVRGAKGEGRRVEGGGWRGLEMVGRRGVVEVRAQLR